MSLIDERKSIFFDICERQIHRKGITDLLSWLENTDFFIAPASTRFHGAEEGGLCKHSLQVYTRMLDLLGFYIPSYNHSQLETAAIISMFHDICKVNMYKRSTRNVKNLDTGLWETVPCYTVDERPMSFGSHGAKSMYLVQNFMQLKPEEASAILHHMGAWDNSQYNNCGSVYDWNKFAWLLHVADEAATYLDKT